MNPRMPIAVVAALTLAASARAQTVPFTRALVSASNPVESVTPQAIHSSPAVASDVSYSKSGDWGSTAGFASADLSAGQLKVRTEAAAAGGSSPYMQSNAWFGDGFHTADASGGAFNWLPNSGARFTMDLTGSVVSSSRSLTELGVGAFVLLSLYKPGTLTSDSKLVGGSNNIGYYLYLLGNPNQTLYYTDDQGVTQQVADNGGYYPLTSDVHVVQDFQPGGDFDWAVLIGASGQVTGSDFYDMDLSHTLTLNYSGPAGTTTTSSSGLFQGFNTVPEPGVTTLAVLLGAMSLRRRRDALRT